MKNVETDNLSQEYWNKMLAVEGLSLSRGLHPNAVYVGSTSELEFIDATKQVERIIGGKRIAPKKQAE